MNDALFPLEQKDAIFDKGDLLSIYMYGKRTWEDLYYFNKELLSEDNNNDKKIKNNKIDKENKENIPDNEPLRALASNKNIQTLSVQEKEEYS